MAYRWRYYYYLNLVPAFMELDRALAVADMHSLPAGWRPSQAVRNNGPDNLALERYKLRELAEGWPMYR